MARRADVWRSLLLLAFAALALLCLTASSWAQPKFPALTGRIVDEAGLLSASDRAVLTSQLAELEKKSTDQLVIVTLKSLQGYEIADYGYRLGRAWALGQTSRKDNGVLLIVVPSAKKVRIEVGRGLEPVLTDATSRLIIENRILPAFRRGDFSAGILAGAKDIQDVLLGDLEGVKARAKGAKRPSSTVKVDWFGVTVFGLFVAYFIYQWIKAARQAQPIPARSGYKNKMHEARNRRERDRDSGWSSGSSGSSGGWSSGSSSGGGSSDSGFSGGGGDFGGGGASSDW
jgi:uncharacterized protein